MAFKWEKSYALVPRALKFYFQVTIQNKYYIQANEYLSNFKIVCIIAAELFLRELVWSKFQTLAIQIFLLKPSCAQNQQILETNNCNSPLVSPTYMNMLLLWSFDNDDEKPRHYSNIHVFIFSSQLSIFVILSYV